MGDRDQVLDESLGLNCAWYADILMTLTGPQPAEADLAPAPAIPGDEPSTIQTPPVDAPPPVA
jgi:hypothetical protein